MQVLINAVVGLGVGRRDCVADLEDGVARLVKDIFLLGGLEPVEEGEPKVVNTDDDNYGEGAPVDGIPGGREGWVL